MRDEKIKDCDALQGMAVAPDDTMESQVQRSVRTLRCENAL